MSEHRNDDASTLHRRDFLKAAGGGLTVAGLLVTDGEPARAQGAADKARLDRLASCTWPIRQLFKTRGGGGRGNAPLSLRAGSVSAPSPGAPSTPANRDRTTTADMKQRYGEITMLDFPQWTKDNFPGVTRMDLFSGLFGDVTDDSMYITAAEAGGGGAGFNPTSPSGRKYLEQLGNILVKTGTKIQHVSNNAPFGLADYGSPEADARRKAGVEMGKRRLEGFRHLGVVSMRMNSTSALGPQIRPNAITGVGDGYPRNLDIIPLMNAAIESYKEMADYGGNLGVKVTFENHWGLAADPMN